MCRSDEDPAAEYPEDVHDDGQATGIRLGVRDLFAKWKKRQKRQFDGLDTEGYPDDRYAEDDSTEEILEEQENPSPEDDPQYVPDQAHRFLFRT